MLLAQRDLLQNTTKNIDHVMGAENIVRQRRDNVATSMDNERRSGEAEKRNETTYRQLISSILYCGSQESGVRDSSTSPSNGLVEEVRGRRGLRQTSWEAQLPVDHADPTDRTIFVVSLDKIIWWRRRKIK
ncbi:hypothetical protein PV325_005291 [Microctonus aethiopoides]|nr:hypothetical protein PV325_005291 [Microctonus aethiopoides]